MIQMLKVRQHSASRLPRHWSLSLSIRTWKASCWTSARLQNANIGAPHWMNHDQALPPQQSMDFTACEWPCNSCHRQLQCVLECPRVFHLRWLRRACELSSSFVLFSHIMLNSRWPQEQSGAEALGSTTSLSADQVTGTCLLRVQCLHYCHSFCCRLGLAASTELPRCCDRAFCCLSIG